MEKRDYYETLGVSRDADATELKKAYRVLAKKYHPDLNPGDETAEKNFKEANEAYECLKDADNRAAYDRYGHAAFQNGGPGAAGAGGRGLVTLAPWVIFLKNSLAAEAAAVVRRAPVAAMIYATTST